MQRDNDNTDPKDEARQQQTATAGKKQEGTYSKTNHIIIIGR